MGWRVTADAGTVAGTNGEFGSLNDDDSVKFLSLSEAVEYGDDPEYPIIAGARFDTLPVPAQIARELDDRLSEMWTLTLPDANTGLGSDPTVFPAELRDPVISDSPIREPFAWDAERLVMWYDDIDPDSFDPSPYQFEDGMVISRSGDPAYRDRDLPKSRERLVDLDGLEPISSDTLAE